MRARTVPQGPWGFGFGLRAMKNFPELIPLVSILSGACVMAASYIGYALYQKPDVTVNKTTSKAEGKPWERINPLQTQKLLTFNQRYERNNELEQLRKEIGSYKS